MRNSSSSSSSSSFLASTAPRARNCTALGAPPPRYKCPGLSGSFACHDKRWLPPKPGSSSPRLAFIAGRRDGRCEAPLLAAFLPPACTPDSIITRCVLAAVHSHSMNQQHLTRARSLTRARASQSLQPLLSISARVTSGGTRSTLQLIPALCGLLCWWHLIADDAFSPSRPPPPCFRVRLAVGLHQGPARTARSTMPNLYGNIRLLGGSAHMQLAEGIAARLGIKVRSDLPCLPVCAAGWPRLVSGQRRRAEVPGRDPALPPSGARLPAGCADRSAALPSHVAAACGPRPLALWLNNTAAGAHEGWEVCQPRNVG